MIYFFYFFSFLLLFFSSNVFLSNNPMRSIFSVIGAFISAAFLLLLIGADFYSFMLVIIYVGAILVLFLFVIMLSGIDYNIKKGLSLGLVCFSLAAILLYKFFKIFNIVPSNLGVVKPNSSNYISVVSIGRAMYSDYFLFFQLIGALLLFSMCGIVTLVSTKNNVRKKLIPLNVCKKANLINQPKGRGVDI